MRRDEQGQSLIEVILLGILFMVPVLWGLGVLAELHRAALATTAAARDGGNEVARSAGERVYRNLDAAIASAIGDSGLDPSAARVRLAPGTSLERGTTIEVTVSYPVSVVRMPFLGSAGGPSIWVESSHVTVVEPFASRADAQE